MNDIQSAKLGGLSLKTDAGATMVLRVTRINILHVKDKNFSKKSRNPPNRSIT